MHHLSIHENDYRSMYGWDLDEDLLSDEHGTTPDVLMYYLCSGGDTGGEVDMLGAITCLTDLLADMVPGIVAKARSDGQSWKEIGNALGMTRQAAQQRFGSD